MSVKIFKGKDKEISKLLMELCEKYYEGPSMDKTYETLTIDSNLDEEMSNDDLWAYNFSGVTDKLYVSLAGEFNIEVTAPLSDWYVDRRFKNEKEKRAVYSNFSMYGGCDMSFAEAVRCIIERRNRDFRYDRNERKAVKSPIDEEVLIELDELYESGEHVNEYEEKLFDDYDKQNYDTGLENEENSCFEIVNGTLKKCITQQEEVIVPDSVTSIGDGAFSECESIRKVSIPHSVISIGSHAFSECPNLEEVIIPNSVTSIGMYAFSCCANLEKIIIPNSVTSIGLCAFNECLSLEEVTIPESVTIIGGRAFSDTKWLDDYPDDFVIVNNNLIKYNGKEKNVIIPDNVKIINEAAFHYCSTPISITIPGSVEFIERDAFSDCNNLTTVTIPESVTFIGPRAFAGCKNLKHVTLPNSVTSISGWLFENCLQLASITIPYSVTNIGIYAFDNCENLNSITIKNIKFKADLKKLSNDFEKAKKMIETKDFTVKISGSLKYVFIIDHYLQTKDEECRKYIQKNILRIIKWLIDEDNNDIISNLIVTGDFVDAKNLDKLLDYANETYKTEIANIFIEYKTKL